MSAPMARRATLGMLALAAALALGACGKKPDFVDPPQGRGNDQFPRPYPNPSTLDTRPGEDAPGVKFP
ncbi:hypothetical protein [Azospirillum sp. A39]|uniref:hypothetical protein n=1 Tax=Azospirillum sp. A39 TaxID=3462279 RepID=UPI004045FDC7